MVSLDKIIDFYDDNLPYVLNEFLGYSYTIRGKSINTIEGYKVELRLFLKYMKNIKMKLNKKEIEDIDITDIDIDFIDSLKLIDLYSFINYATIKRGNSSYARARKISAIKAFYKYLCEKLKALKDNPSLELESPKLSKRNPIYLTLDESIDLLRSVDGRNKERDYCIIIFFLNCGMRLSELVGINISRINGDTLTVIGKGNKERTVYLNDSCMDALRAYLNVRPKEGLEDEDALFLSERKRRIDKRSVERLVKKYVKKSGLFGEKYTPHKLRHTAATLMYKYGSVDIRALKEILGHESVSTTQIYTHVDEEKLRDAVMSNPLANLSMNKKTDK